MVVVVADTILVIIYYLTGVDIAGLSGDCLSEACSILVSTRILLTSAIFSAFTIVDRQTEDKSAVGQSLYRPPV